LSAGGGSGRLAVLATAAFAVGAALLVWLRPVPPSLLRVGAPTPELRLPDLDGKPVALSELRGRVVFVNFWGTWCAPCRDEAPALERMYRKLHGEGFEVLAVSIDAPDAHDAVRAFRDEFALSFPILLDADRATYGAFGATGVPETFLVDREGRIWERFVGPRDWDHPRYERAVRGLLGAAPLAGARTEGS
jgi:peroxiredoxin